MCKLGRPVLDAFRKRLLEAFKGTYEGPLEHYLGCEVMRDMVAGTIYNSLKSIMLRKFYTLMDIGIPLRASRQ